MHYSVWFRFTVAATVTPQVTVTGQGAADVESYLQVCLTVENILPKSVSLLCIYNYQTCNNYPPMYLAPVSLAAHLQL